MSKNGFSPQLMLLEGREQPGSMLTTGLDASILAGAFLGDTLVKSSRPAILATQEPAKKADASDVVVQPLSHSLNTQSAGTIKQAETQSLDTVNGLFAPTAPKTFASLSQTGAPSGYTAPFVGGDDGGDGSGSRIPYTFYNGGNDFVNGFTSEMGTAVSESNTWNDVRTRFSTTITGFSATTYIDNVGGGVPLPTTANFRVRGPGIMPGGGGDCLATTEIAVLSVPVTTTFVSGGPYFGAYEEYLITSTGPMAVVLPGPAHRYISIQPNGTGVGQFFQATTSGAGQIGQPTAPNNDTWLSSSHFGLPCAKWDTLVGAGVWETSVGITGTIP